MSDGVDVDKMIKRLYANNGCIRFEESNVDLSGECMEPVEPI